MKSDHISSVEIGEDARLHIVPESSKFPYIYREAMEVNWDSERGSLYSPEPREWGYERWFNHILSAAKEQGVELKITANTVWQNVPMDLKQTLLHAHASGS